MANLKLDLLNKLRNDKYYQEMELVRLAQEPNMEYKLKIDLMDMKLEEIVLTNQKTALVDQYMQDAPAEPQANAPAPAPAKDAPKGNVHQGQSHGE